MLVIFIVGVWRRQYYIQSVVENMQIHLPLKSLSKELINLSSPVSSFAPVTFIPSLPSSSGSLESSDMTSLALYEEDFNWVKSFYTDGPNG